MSSDLKRVSEELSERIAMAKQAIGEAALEGEMNRVQAIANAVKRLQEAEGKVAEITKEIRRAMVEFDAATKSHTKSPHTKLLIKIRWKLVGEDRADELIDDDKAADALVHFIESLVDVYGIKILTDLENIRVGSSNLVSQSPTIDFVNPKSGEQYGYRQISRTLFYVKTHTSTTQKADQVGQIKTLLGMPRHSVEVDVVGK